MLTGLGKEGKCWYTESRCLPLIKVGQQKKLKLSWVPLSLRHGQLFSDPISWVCLAPGLPSLLVNSPWFARYKYILPIPFQDVLYIYFSTINETRLCNPHLGFPMLVLSRAIPLLKVQYSNYVVVYKTGKIASIRKKCAWEYSYVRYRWYHRANIDFEISRVWKVLFFWKTYMEWKDSHLHNSPTYIF